MDTKAAMRADGAALCRGRRACASHRRGRRRPRGRCDRDQPCARGISRAGPVRGPQACSRRHHRRRARSDCRRRGGETEPFVENKPIMQPFGDRSKVVIEPMLTDQWFVDTAKIVQPAIDAVRNGDTQILPEQDAKVYFHWLENIEPWCISRQLWWGHQIPVWFDLFGNQFCAATEAEAIEQARTLYEESFPNVAVHVRVSEEALSTYVDPEGRERPMGGFSEAGWVGEPLSSISVRISRDPDVLDTWFSSGLWPIGTLGWPDGHAGAAASTSPPARWSPASTSSSSGSRG